MRQRQADPDVARVQWTWARARHVECVSRALSLCLRMFVHKEVSADMHKQSAKKLKSLQHLQVLPMSVMLIRACYGKQMWLLSEP